MFWKTIKPIWFEKAISNGVLSSLTDSRFSRKANKVILGNFERRRILTTWRAVRTMEIFREIGFSSSLFVFHITLNSFGVQGVGERRWWRGALKGDNSTRDSIDIWMRVENVQTEWRSVATKNKTKKKKISHTKCVPLPHRNQYSVMHFSAMQVLPQQQ